jgi:hypothetical protein
MYGILEGNVVKSCLVLEDSVCQALCGNSGDIVCQALCGNSGHNVCQALFVGILEIVCVNLSSLV